jgi:non-ribosomal peptide synthetase component F
LLRATEEGLRQARELQSYWSWDEKDEKSPLPENGYFRYAFAFEQRVRRTEMGHVKVDVLSQYNCVERFRLKLVCVQAEDGSTVCDLHYDQGVFVRSDVERLAQQYGTLLRCAISDGARQVAELEIVSATEREQLVVKFNQTARQFVGELCLHQLFEQSAEQTPDAVARGAPALAD